MDEVCGRCGRSRFDHIPLDGALYCPLEYEPEEPRCAYCESGWRREKRDRRKNADHTFVCTVNRDMTHRRPEDPDT